MKRNPEKAREAMRRWRASHPEAHSAERRAFYARHRDDLLATSAEYHRTHREVRKASDGRRRITKLRGGPSFTAEEWLALVAAHQGRCAYCGSLAPLQADHRVPLARGGSNAIANILPACGSCNARKHILSEDEFRARLDQERRETP